MASASELEVACFRPIRAWRAPGGGASFTPRQGYTDLPELELGCGQCIGCRLDRAREWATRCVHEAQLHEENSFLTLTYEEAPRSLDKQAYRLFMRRLRKHLGKHQVKYFQCGEYGDELGRPHYHAILFGYWFPDARHWKTGPSGHAQYRSDELEYLWGHGICSLGPVTFETAAYVARYVTKKVNGDLAAAHYAGRTPEYMACSKGIGEAWIKRYAADTYRDDFVVMRGARAPVPRYYDKKLEELDPELLRQVKLARVRRGATSQARANRTPERLQVREEVTHARTQISKGSL